MIRFLLTRLSQQILSYPEVFFFINPLSQVPVFTSYRKLLFKKSYESKIQSAEAAIAAVEQERQQAIEHNRENYAWIDIFKKYQNITFIERKTVVELLEEIIVHEDKKIRLCFRYGDQYTKLVELLENYSGTAE